MSGWAGQGGSVGSSTFSSVGGAVSDIFGGYSKNQSLKLKAQGDEVEAENYDRAATLALQNEQFTKVTTDLKEEMAQRQLSLGIGATETAVAGAGFANSGTSLDLLRDSASQGALEKAVLGQQGLIQEASFHEQAESYHAMAEFGRMSADKERKMGSLAQTMGYITGAIKIGGAVAGAA